MMIIITADDYGRTKKASDSILECFSNKSITAASAMVFMEDSERAASRAVADGVETGLHLNYTLPFNDGRTSLKTRDYLERVAGYLNKNKLAQIVYNPLLAKSFTFLFRVQTDEYVRLYGKMPAFYNGHHHMHLCANMVMSNLLPKGSKIRRTFTFEKNEKGFGNITYRRLLDHMVTKRFASTDYLFSIQPLDDMERIRMMFGKGAGGNVEIEVHPEDPGELRFLLSDRFMNLMGASHPGSFNLLTRKGQ